MASRLHILDKYRKWRVILFYKFNDTWNGARLKQKMKIVGSSQSSSTMSERQQSDKTIWKDGKFFIHKKKMLGKKRKRRKVQIGSRTVNSTAQYHHCHVSICRWTRYRFCLCLWNKKVEFPMRHVCVCACCVFGDGKSSTAVNWVTENAQKKNYKHTQRSGEKS